MKNVKIIFVDIDGTLLNNKSIITDYTRKVIKKVMEKNIYVIMCSGRANNDLIEKSKYANTNPIIISSNGTAIFDYKQNIKIYESKIDFKLLKSIWDFSIRNNIELTFNSIYKRFKTENSKKEADIISSLYEIDENITQIVAETNSYKSIKSLVSFMNKFKTLESGYPISHHDTPNNIYYELDIHNHFINKGEAIKILLKYLNLDKNCALCFGDGRNDYSMFSACGYKVAMINGNDKLKEMADFITEFSNEEEGVAKFMEKNLLN